MPEPEVRQVEWVSVTDWLHEVAHNLANYDSVVGVSRGGAVLAIYLSYIAENLPLHFAYRSTPPGTREPFYVFDSSREARLETNLSSFQITKGFDSRRPLVVDDVATFGDTLTIVERMLIARGADLVEFVTYAADIKVLTRERPEILPRLSNRIAIDNSSVWLSFPWQGEA